MPSAIIAALIIGAAIVAAPHLAPATYQIAATAGGAMALRVNTKTGEVRLCVPDRAEDLRVPGGLGSSCPGGGR